jgi:histidine triad (HIT) family protein
LNESSMTENAAKECALCSLVARRIPRWVVHETENVICFLPLELNAHSHTVIAPKAHFADLFDIPKELLQELAVTAKRLAGHYKQAVGAMA